MTEDDALTLAVSVGLPVGEKTRVKTLKLIDAVLERAARVADQRGDVPVYPGWEVTSRVHARKSEARIIAQRIRDLMVRK